MEKIGATRCFRAIDDYLVFAKDGKTFSFKNVATTPVRNEKNLRSLSISWARGCGGGVYELHCYALPDI
jgi:hypothetical protein